MSFIHEDPEFDELLQIVADERKLSRGLVEKDYWVTHTLWALHIAGFEIWFKGGTSLSKGFRLIERFSEDLDLKIDPGTVSTLLTVSNWKSEGTKAIAERRAYFEKLAELILVPGARAALDADAIDKTWRKADILVRYPGHHLGDLGGVMSPFVRLEIGSARVTPFIVCGLTSFVHERLSAHGQLGAFDENRPSAVRCVHPLVTLIEKLDAIRRRFPSNAEPAQFVRHYEDAARIIDAAPSLMPLSDYDNARAVAADMLAQKQIAGLANRMDPAFAPAALPRWDAIRDAHAAVGQMFWGSRIPLDDACITIRNWIDSALM